MGTLHSLRVPHLVHKTFLLSVSKKKLFLHAQENIKSYNNCREMYVNRCIIHLIKKLDSIKYVIKELRLNLLSAKVPKYLRQEICKADIIGSSIWNINKDQHKELRNVLKSKTFPFFQNQKYQNFHKKILFFKKTLHTQGE